jgi:hypothetical protein
MSKEKFLRVYNRINIAFGVMLVLFVVMFFAEIPAQFNGVIEKNIFALSFQSHYILNAPLFVFTSLLLLNIYLLIRVKNVIVDNKYLQNVIFNNVTILLMLLVGHLVFYFSFPEAMNGEVVNKFLYLRFQIRNDEFLNVINVNYILSGGFLFYNLFVAYKTKEEKVKEFDEELYEDQFFKQLEKDE